MVHRIVTITFSPCIDKSTSVSQLIPEKKMKCDPPHFEPGGGGINVARAIKKLGGEALAIYPAGGYTGKYFTRLLSDENVPAVIIETKNDTRENIIVLEQSSGEQFRFGMPANPLLEDEWEKMIQVLEEIKEVQYIVASGSLPPGVPADIFARIAFIAKKKEARFIADTSGEALRHAADEGVFLLKPNLAELSYLTGKEYLEEHEISSAARQLLHKGKCEAIVVSMGKAGALLVTNDKEKNFVPPHVKRISTVGAGDSMVAGIVLALHDGKDLETAVRYGVACGTAATLNPGTELCRPEDAGKLFNLVNTKQGAS